jgi:hypothetical protein
MTKRCFAKKIMKDIDDVIAPDNMTMGDALEWLEKLQTEIACRIDAVKDAMRKAGQDWGD